MSKMKVSWYENNLVNWDRTLKEENERILRRLKEHEGSAAQRDFLAHQIAEAKKKGLTEFDQDRFCVKRVVVAKD